MNVIGYVIAVVVLAMIFVLKDLESIHRDYSQV